MPKWWKNTTGAIVCTEAAVPNCPGAIVLTVTHIRKEKGKGKKPASLKHILDEAVKNITCIELQPLSTIILISCVTTWEEWIGPFCSLPTCLVPVGLSDKPNQLLFPWVCGRHLCTNEERESPTSKENNWWCLSLKTKFELLRKKWNCLKTHVLDSVLVIKDFFWWDEWCLIFKYWIMKHVGIWKFCITQQSNILQPTHAWCYKRGPEQNIHLQWKMDNEPKSESPPVWLRILHTATNFKKLPFVKFGDRK